MEKNFYFEIVRQNLILGINKLREMNFTMFLSYGAEGKETHTCWVVRYFFVGMTRLREV